MHRSLTDAALGGTHTPYPGAITPDTLHQLFEHQRARYAGFTMKDDDGDDEGDEGDDDEFDTGDSGDEGDDEGDDEGEGDDEKLGAAGVKALKAERARNKKLREQLRAATAKAEKGAGDDDAEAKVAAKWKPRVVNSAAKAALLSAGAEKPERLLRLIDHDELDVSDDGDVEGLDEEVDRLKEEYPELFAKPRRSGGRVETGDRSGAGGPKKKLSATERQAAQLAGKK